MQGQRILLSVWLATALELAAPPSFAGEPFKVLHDFAGMPEGSRPNASLVVGPDGLLYGTTSAGGTSTRCHHLGCGTIFRMQRDGATTVLHSFDLDITGQFPWAPLMLASDGNFYGTAWYGGRREGGTLFRMRPDGSFKLLHSFKLGGAEGSNPGSALVEGPDGALYGTTSEGGIGRGDVCFANDAKGCGTIFKYSSESGYTVLHSFTGQGGDGAFPASALLLANDGNFYGVTWSGGASQHGTLYRMTPQGAVTILHYFDSSTGSAPHGGLVQAPDGALYGTTSGGGRSNDGTVFRITLAGDHSVLHEFDETQEGCFPVGSLVFGPGDLLYGALSYGGDFANCSPAGCGAVYSISTNGTYKTLHTFNGSDGVFPSDGLTRLGDKKLVGPVQFGGRRDEGVIFRITP